MDDGNVADDAVGEQKWCQVYDKNDFFTVLVQLALAFLALASLYLKRLREVPRRTFRTWFLDVSKQGFGACYAHVMNMVIAAVISNNIRGEAELQDQCAWYGISYLIDTTLGLVLAIVFLRILDRFANERDWAHLKHSGVYSEERGGLVTWGVQVVAWLIILTVVKVIIYLFMWACSEPLAWMGALLFAPLQFNIHFELVFVMILFPGVLNVIYFWIADGYLKAKKEHTTAHENDETGLEDKKESLIADADDTPESFSFYQPLPWTAFFQRKAKEEGADASEEPALPSSTAASV